MSPRNVLHILNVPRELGVGIRNQPTSLFIRVHQVVIRNNNCHLDVGGFPVRRSFPGEAVRSKEKDVAGRNRAPVSGCIQSNPLTRGLDSPRGNGSIHSAGASFVAHQ